MRVFHISAGGAIEQAELPQRLPASGHVWIACTRQELQDQLSTIQATLQALCGLQLVDLHVSDLLNAQLPSHFDYTSQYDLLVFRRLATGSGANDGNSHVGAPTRPHKRGGPPILKRIDTSPVGFAVFERVLLTVHPADCAARDAYAVRLL